MTLKELVGNINTWKLTRERVIHLSIGLAALLILEFIARAYYRPYIYSHHIYDFHLADTLGNSLGTIAGVFITIGLVGQNRAHHLYLINVITIAFVIYELAHPLLGKPIDGWDVLATFLSGGFCILLYKLIHPAR